MNRDKLVQKAVREIEIAKNHFQTLGVGEDSSPTVIKRAYRALCLLVHPDKNGSSQTTAEAFKKLNQANEILKDDTERLKYIKELCDARTPIPVPQSTPGTPYNRWEEKNPYRHSTPSARTPFSSPLSAYFKCPKCRQTFGCAQASSNLYHSGEESLCCPCGTKMAKVQCQGCDKFNNVDSCNFAERQRYGCAHCEQSFSAKFPVWRKSYQQSTPWTDPHWVEREQARKAEEKRKTHEDLRKAQEAQEHARAMAEERARQDAEREQARKAAQVEAYRKAKAEAEAEEIRRRQAECIRAEEIRQAGIRAAELEKQAEAARKAALETERLAQEASVRAAEAQFWANIRHIKEQDDARYAEEQRRKEVAAAMTPQPQRTPVAPQQAQDVPPSSRKRRNSMGSSSKSKRMKIEFATPTKRKLDDLIAVASPLPTDRQFKKYTAKGAVQEARTPPAKKYKIDFTSSVLRTGIK